MEEGAKRRLVGAAVIVVLLVIFVPMFLEEGEIVRPVSEREMSIPPRPDFEQGYDTSVWEEPVDPPGSRFREYEEPTREDLPLPQEIPPPALIDAPATTEPEFIPKSVPVPPAAEPPPAPRKETPPASKPTPSPKKETRPSKATTKPKPASAQPPAPPPASAIPASWVIQVTSLQERERAYAIVQDLRAKGFPAYLQEARVDRRLWHRVRVGPELGRERIKSMAASLRAKTGLKGQIQRYP